jgi:hypothetical protein
VPNPFVFLMIQEIYVNHLLFVYCPLI